MQKFKALSPIEVLDIATKVIPAYYEGVNEQLVQFSNYGDREFHVYDEDIMSFIASSLGLTWSAIHRNLPRNIVDQVVAEYTKVGWSVSRPTELKCNQGPHYIFSEGG